MRLSFVFALLGVCTTAQALTNDQQLVIASFQLDVERVKTLLAAGANPNSRLGFYSQRLFEDKWANGLSPIGSNEWTPLQAVAHSHSAPQPEERPDGSLASLDASLKKLRAVDPKLIRKRDQRRVAIAKILIAAKADLDLHDGYGSTALSSSVYQRCNELSLLLIESGAELDTKTGIYIDGPGNITPMHWAVYSPAVLAAMIKRGVNVNVRDTSGDTPLRWAVRSDKVNSVRLLLAAGAEVGEKEAIQISRLLEKAQSN